MTNRTALIIGLGIALAVGLDLAMGWGAGLFLARKFALLVEWVAFWR